MKIELHMLQSFPPSNLNRDDSGMPKDCEFGGYRRARISSQCLKRSIRYSDQFIRRSKKVNSYILDKFQGKRSQLYYNEYLKELIEKTNYTQKECEQIAKNIAGAFGSGMKKEKEDENKNKTDTLVFSYDSEVSDIVEYIKENDNKDLRAKDLTSKENRKKVATYLEKFAKNKNATVGKIESVDIALFGRMLASLPKMKIDAACQLAHAISTNKISMEFDYFTAVDDLNPEEETGAGMIGSTPFNSACYYRYSVIDSDQLMHNLGNKKDLAKEGILGFIEGSVFAVPSGKINAFAQDVQPDFVMVVIRENDAPANLANAFEEPANPDNKKSLSEISIIKLAKQWEKLNNMYGFENNLVAVASTNRDHLGELSKNGSIVGSLKDVIAATEDYLNANIREA